MPRRDFYHFQIRTALEKDGWKVTADPYKVIWEGKIFLPDLGAERVLAIEKGTEKLAVEIKSFLGEFGDEFYKALGQFDSYFFCSCRFRAGAKSSACHHAGCL